MAGMDKGAESNLFLRLVPGGGWDEPTLWWAAARFIHGARRFEELQTQLQETASNWKLHPHVHRRTSDEEVEVGGPSDEFFNSRPEASALASEALLHFRAVARLRRVPPVVAGPRQTPDGHDVPVLPRAPYADPDHPDHAALAVYDPELKFVPIDRKIDANTAEAATDELIVVMQGIVEFLNPLLEEGKVSPINLQCTGRKGEAAIHE
jgi:hypothetical protein